MKSFFTIIGLYLLVLGLLPCSDVQACGDAVKTEVSATQNHEEHQQHPEACSPFCICACCASTSFSVAAARTIELQLPFQQELYSFYNNDLLAEMHSPIWQPPRLS